MNSYFQGHAVELWIAVYMETLKQTGGHAESASTATDAVKSLLKVISDL